MWILAILFVWLVALTIALGIVAFVGWKKFHIVADVLDLQTYALETMRRSIPVSFPRYADAVIELPVAFEPETKSCLPEPENTSFFTQSAPVK